MNKESEGLLNIIWWKVFNTRIRMFLATWKSRYRGFKALWKFETICNRTTKHIYKINILSQRIDKLEEHLDVINDFKKGE